MTKGGENAVIAKVSTKVRGITLRSIRSNEEAHLRYVKCHRATNCPRLAKVIGRKALNLRPHMWCSRKVQHIHCTRCLSCHNELKPIYMKRCIMHQFMYETKVNENNKLVKQNLTLDVKDVEFACFKCQWNTLSEIVVRRWRTPNLMLIVQVVEGMVIHWQSVTLYILGWSSIN